jgi:hypothetical protein
VPQGLEGLQFQQSASCRKRFPKQFWRFQERSGKIAAVNRFMIADLKPVCRQAKSKMPNRKS